VPHVLIYVRSHSLPLISEEWHALLELLQLQSLFQQLHTVPCMVLPSLLACDHNPTISRMPLTQADKVNIEGGGGVRAR
jgi:hypothetical protein